MAEKDVAEGKYFIGTPTGFRLATEKEISQTLPEKLLEGHVDKEDIPDGGMYADRKG